MNSWLRLALGVSLGGFILFAPSARAAEEPLQDPDLQEMLQQAQELQKKAGHALTPVKMSDLKKQAAALQEEQRAEARKEKAALEKQLAAPGPVAFPDWTPVTPQFHVLGPPKKKIVDDEVRIVQTGTSPLTPKGVGRCLGEGGG